MNCQHCQPLLLDHLYGLLDGPEAAAVDAHLASCPACAAARTETARVQGLFARAAKSAFPNTRFEAPTPTQPQSQPAKSGPTRTPARGFRDARRAAGFQRHRPHRVRMVNPPARFALARSFRGRSRRACCSPSPAPSFRFWASSTELPPPPKLGSRSRSAPTPMTSKPPTNAVARRVKNGSAKAHSSARCAAQAHGGRRRLKRLS